MVNRTLAQYDIGVKNMASFIAASAITTAGAFVEMSATDYTVRLSVASGTTKPLGISTASAVAASTTNEVRTGGYVWQVANATMPAGSPVYPGASQRVIKTGRLVSGLTTGIFPAGFGTVVVGGVSSAFILVKLHGLV